MLYKYTIYLLTYLRKTPSSNMLDGVDVTTYICRLDECREYLFRFAVWKWLTTSWHPTVACPHEL